MIERSKSLDLVVSGEPADSADPERHDLNSIVHPNSQNEGGGHGLDQPTVVAGAEWQFLYTYANERLFDSELPDCMITHVRHPRMMGYFYPSRYMREDGTRCHEIALNPTYLSLFGDREYQQTLVHEMCHLWRFEFGPPNRKGGRGTTGYHDLPWVHKMEQVGLCPSHTGKPGGRKTGYQMMEYAIEGGPFDIAFRELALTGFRISWRDDLETDLNASRAGDDSPGERRDRATARTKTRPKFTCPSCGLNAWAKQGARLSCTACGVEMIANHSKGTKP